MGADVKTGEGYLQTQKSIFKSDAEIEALYSECGKLSDAEKLALKNLELSKSANGSLDDFNRAMDVAERYKCTELESKIGIMSNESICEKYSCFKDITPDEVERFKAYDYFKKSGIDDMNLENLGIKSDSSLISKYKFLENGDDLTDIIRMYEYRNGNMANAQNLSKFIVENSDDIVKATNAESLAKLVVNYSDDIVKATNAESLAKLVVNYSDDIVNVADKSLYTEIISNYADDILKAAGKDSIKIGEYTLSKELGWGENIVDGSVLHSGTNMELAESIVKEGSVVEGTNGNIYKSANKGSATITVVNVVTGAFLIFDFSKTTYNAVYNEMYLEGNYKTGSKELITYGIVQLAALGGSEFFAAGATAICAAAGVTICAPVAIFAAIAGGIICGVIGEDIGDIVGDLVCWLFGYEDSEYGSASNALRYIADPLVLDFDGDGFETLSVNDGVYFDEDVKGLVEKTAWVSSDDALLAIDLNENGTIDNGSELFGTSTRLVDGTYAKNGFEALSQYDLNKDNVIDSKDEVYSKLLIWQDKNSDGISQDEELMSLSDANIKSISLSTNNESGRNTAIVTYEDGLTTKLGEFDFEAQYYNTIEKDSIVISAEIEKLPDVHAIGNIESLHTLMQRDETGTLKNYVEQFGMSESREEKEELVKKILIFIAGADNIASNSRGSQMDAKVLTVIEKFMGRDFIGTAGSDPVNTAAPILNGIYNDIFNTYYCLLNSQTQLSNYMGLLYVTESKDGIKTINTDVFNQFIQICRENGADMSEIVGEMGRYIKYINASDPDNFVKYVNTYISDSLYLKEIVKICNCEMYIGDSNDNTYTGTGSADAVFGEQGNDSLYGADGADILLGDEGNDNLYGGSGADILVGGSGNDYLDGEIGNDTYVFNIGDGKDTISDYENSSTGGKSDKILFGEGISPENVKLERVGYDLIIKYSEEDSIIVKNAYYYADGRYFVENIEFSDGTIWNADDVSNRARVHYGTEETDTMNGYGWSLGYSVNEIFYGGAGDDVISAGNGDDYLYGESGADKLYGEAGDDTLIGGSGNDYLDGGIGNDTYVFNIGDGKDTISDYENSSTEGKSDKILFGEGISPENVKLERVGYDLIIKYSEEDSITVKNAYYYGDGRYFVENIEFVNTALYSVDYKNVSLELIENYVEENVRDNIEPDSNVTSEYSVTENINIDEIVSTISSTSIESISDSSGIAIGETDDTNIMVDNMLNLVIQEMSENTTSNLSDISELATTIPSNDNVQLWIAN